MANIFIGFEIRKGSFKKNGEDIDYNNRILRFITDEGADNTHVGFDYIEYKMSLESLAGIFGCSASDSAIDDTLINLIQSEVNMRYAPRNGVTTLVYFAPVKKA